MSRIETLARQITDDFTRPSDTTAYAAGDAVSATTSNTGTTPLRGLRLASDKGKAFWLTFLSVITSLDTFLPRLRVHFYTKAAPTTAVVGDNVAFTRVYANRLEYLGYVDMPALADVGDCAYAVRDDLRLHLQPSQSAEQGEGDDQVYYRIETLDAATPGSAQTFSLMARASDN